MHQVTLDLYINFQCSVLPFFSRQKNATTIAVEVKKSQHKYVIGPKGNTLQEILEKTGVSVEIPPPDSNSETVILRGEPDRLGQALTEVYAKVDMLHIATHSTYYTGLTEVGAMVEIHYTYTQHLSHGLGLAFTDV